MLLFTIPGILYMILAEGSPVHTTVVAIPEGEKTRLLLSGEDDMGKAQVGVFLAGLPN